ncbi:hypothetical protein HDR66_03760 [bacterium]|nr:hypothetical protein [bacterium]
MKKIIPISFLMAFITIAPTMAAQTTINICYDIVPFLTAYHYATDYYNTIFSNDTSSSDDYTRACEFDEDSDYYKCSPLSQQSCDLSSDCKTKTFDEVYKKLNLQTTSGEQIKIRDGFTSMYWEISINYKDNLQSVTAHTQAAYECLNNTTDTNCQKYVLPVPVNEDITNLIKSENLDDANTECGLILTPVFGNYGLTKNVPNKNCPIGYYCNSGNGAITQCPLLHTTKEPGADSEKDCTIHGTHKIKLNDKLTDEKSSRTISLYFQ